MTSCLNCGAAVNGRYCADCGQRASFHLGFHDFVHQATHEFLHFDDKILHTLRLLILRPGQLTREFIAGRRAGSISPIRLYLVASALFFWVVFTFGSSIGALRIGNQSAPIGGEHSAATSGPAAPGGAETAHVRKVAEAFGHALPKAMFLLMPVSALLLWGLYYREQPYYIAHLYFSIHLHALAFLAFSAMALIKASGVKVLFPLAALILPWLGYYLVASQRTFYEVRWPTAIFRAFLGTFVYLVVFTLMVYGLARFAIATA